VLKHLLQRDAIDARVGEIEPIDAHLPEAVLHVGIDEPGDPDEVVAVVDADDALGGEAATGLVHKKAAVATDIDDRVALDTVENLRLAVGQGHCTEQGTALLGRERLPVDEISLRGTHFRHPALAARGNLRRRRW